MIDTAPQQKSQAPRFVYTRMMDGLGNQLFEYAAGRALADRLGAQLRLDCGWFANNSSRTFELDAFSIDAVRDWSVRAVPNRWFKLPTRSGKRLTAAIHNRMPRRISVEGHRYKVFDEKQIYRYDPHFAALAGSVYLTGWWQSPRYFESASATIRRELRLRSPRDAFAMEWLTRIRSVNAVAVHVRRGDYLLSPDRATCSPAYYATAMEFVRLRLPDARFFVFSDDPEWCRKNVTSDDVVIVQENASSAAVADLALMSACRHHIIANSSFSWWGAWLSDATNQIVVAPKEWIVGFPTTNDFVAKRWTNFLRL